MDLRSKGLKRSILTACRLSGLTALARTLTRSGFNIIGFHGVSLEDEHLRFPTLFISPESFERRLQFLTRHYRIVPLDEALRQHREGRIQPRQVVLTFDDGFYNFLGRAIPLLRKYDAHGTVYVVTSDVDTDEPMFNLLLRDVILAAPRPSATGLPHAPDTTCDLSTIALRNRLVTDVVAAFKQACGTRDERFAYARAVGAALDVDVDAKLGARLWDRLTPDEIRQVARDGFGVQLHTHSHRNVVEHRDRVRDEVRTNREILERLSGTDAADFCYPLGLWDRGVWPDLEAEGVRSAVTTRNGPNYPQTPALSLRRYLTGEAMSDAELEFELSGLRWLARAATSPATRFAPTEKRVRYKDQPELY